MGRSIRLGSKLDLGREMGNVSAVWTIVLIALLVSAGSAAAKGSRVVLSIESFGSNAATGDMAGV